MNNNDTSRILEKLTVNIILNKNKTHLVNKSNKKSRHLFYELTS